MSVPQLEARRVVKEAAGGRPCIERLVARVALRRVEDAQVGLVRWVRRSVEIVHVARLTCRRKPQVIPGRGVLMAFIALHYGVRAQERKSVEVLRDCLNGNLPTRDRVALRAIRSELSTVEVRMAIGAILADVGENRFDVAASARNLLMHAAQRISRRVVIKFGDRADGRPACRRVAVLAGNIERAVRTLLRLSLRRECGQSRGNHQQNAEPSSEPE